jgi:xanthine dehydrogenase YagS FAD-binding subunit
MKKFEYAQPEDVSNVFTLLEEPNSAVKAGGVDLLDLMKEGIYQPDRLVNIQNLDGLNFIREDNGGMKIGAVTSLADLAAHATLSSGPYRCLAQAAQGVATPQIRNMATLAGNLCQRPRCWYFRSEDFNCARNGGDLCYAIDGENQYHAIFGHDDGCVMVLPSATAIALTALAAKLTISDGQKEQEVDIADFFVPPAQDITRETILADGQLITAVSLPKPAKGLVSFYYKIKEKQSSDWPAAEIALAMVMNGNTCKDARIILGAAAPVPWRISKAEALLKGRDIDVSLACKAADAALQDARPLSLNSYKVPVFRAAIYRSICWAVGIDPLADSA